jgi:hypothetical protein
MAANAPPDRSQAIARPSGTQTPVPHQNALERETSAIRLAYVLPTLGRPTLARAVESLAGAGLTAADALIVVWDALASTPAIDWPGLCGPCGARVDRLWADSGAYGNAGRNKGLAHATSIGATHVAYMDDDDVATPGAVAAIKAGIALDPHALHVFRMQYTNGEVRWRDNDRALRLGNIGTPCLVHPVGVRSRWGQVYQSDIAFAVDVAHELGRVCYNEAVVCIVRPAQEGV